MHYLRSISGLTLSWHVNKRMRERGVEEDTLRNVISCGRRKRSGPTLFYFLPSARIAPAPGEPTTLSVVVRDRTVVTTYWCRGELR